MSDKIMIDTNLWVYLYARKPDEKYRKSRQIIDENFISVIVSTQILGELYHVLTRKNLSTKEDAKQIVIETITIFPIAPIDTSNVLKALDINEKYQYSYWDSLLIATALLHHCNILYSEDMQHNQVIENKLRIINPL